MLDALFDGCDRPAPRGLCSLEPISTAALASAALPIVGKFFGGGGGGAAPSVTKQENQQITNVSVSLGEGGGGAAARLLTGLYTSDPSLGGGGQYGAVGGDYLVNALEGFPSPITGTAVAQPRSGRPRRQPPAQPRRRRSAQSPPPAPVCGGTP